MEEDDEKKLRIAQEFHAILKELNGMHVALMAGLAKNARSALLANGVVVTDKQVCLALLAGLIQCAPGFHNRIAAGELDQAMKVLQAAVVLAESMTVQKGGSVEALEMTITEVPIPKTTEVN